MDIREQQEVVQADRQQAFERGRREGRLRRFTVLRHFGRVQSAEFAYGERRHVLRR